MTETRAQYEVSEAPQIAEYKRLNPGTVTANSIAFCLEAVVGWHRPNRPVAVLVNPANEERARAALAELDVNLPVKTLGGCLVGEVWIGVTEEEER
jgi:hypothetical protein